MTRLEAASLRPVLERLGMPYEYRDGGDERWFGWNGKALNLAVRADISSVIHEVAHWQLAVPARRGFADFGLTDFRLPDMLRDMGLPPREQYLPWGCPDEEECLASLLGILMERHLGLPWKDTWSFHDWDQDDHLPGKGWGLRRYFRKLQRAGLLRGLAPTCFMEGV